ncbi:MAG: hypothetical protein V3U45_08410 [bacterium]
MATRLERARTFVRERVLRRPPQARYDAPPGWVLEKSGNTRSVPPKGLVGGSRTQQGIWVPITRPEGLVLLTDLVWILGAGVDRVVEETTKGGHDWEPLFQALCPICGAEYDVEPDEMCETPGCFSEEFEKADPLQLEGGPWHDGGIKRLMEKPNWDPRTGMAIRSWKDLTKDATYYNNVIGWWNWEVIYDALGRPVVLNAMNSESMRKVDDPNITLPGPWFCPACHREMKDGDKIDVVFHTAHEEEESPTCPDHGVFLKRPDWVQLGEGDIIVAVWAVEEILTDMPRARGMRIYPRSKIHRTWALGQTMRWTERFDLSALSGQRSPDAVVTVSGRDQSEVNQMLDDWEDWRNEHPEYEGVIWFGLGTESGEVKIQHFMGDLINRDFIAWGEAAMKAVAMNLGVSFVFVGGQEAGKLGKSEEQLQVSYDTIEENQSQIEEFVNGKLVPLFPEITHWKYVQKPPAPEDLEKKANEAAAWANAVAAFRAAGANAKLDPQAGFDWPIIIDDWEERQETPEPGVFPGGEGLPGKEPEGGGPFEFGPFEFSMEKAWTAFQTASGSTGAVNDQGRKVYGEEAKRVLAGERPARGEGEGKPRGGVQGEKLKKQLTEETVSTIEEAAKVLDEESAAKVYDAVQAMNRGDWQEAQRLLLDAGDDAFEQGRSDLAQRLGAASAEASRGGGEIPESEETKAFLREKSLTTRGIPPEEAIAGIRKAEDELAGKLKRRLSKAARDFRRMAGRQPSQSELRRLTADIAHGLQEEFGRLGAEYVGKAYRLGLEEEKAVTPEAAIEARDRSEIRRLEDDPDFLKGRLSKVVADATGTIADEIRAALAAGESTGAAAARAADMLGEELWKVERIVRSETTNAANVGRIVQFEKHGRPEDEYGIVSAKDRRRCPICKAADDGIDTLTAEERAEFDRSDYDPSLFHGNPYTLTEIKSLWRAYKSFHGNCRCTIRRHVALA